jgi:glycosyltransferase involved in cell wall biosynthesis
MPVFFGSILKNIAPHFHVFEECLRDLQDRIPNLKICLYEDGSTDGTKDLLASFQRQNPDVHVRCDTVDWLSKSRVRTWDNKPCRIECIAEARNHLMRMLEQRGMGERDEDVVIFMDADIPTKPDLNRIIQLVSKFPENVDGVFANGVSQWSGRYYDMFAYRDMTSMFGDEVYGEKAGKDASREKSERVTQLLANAKTLVPVVSAFGGLAIYRGKSIVWKRYSAFPTKEMDDFYMQFMLQNPTNSQTELLLAAQGDVETHKDGALLGIYLHYPREVGGLFYWNCCGYNWPIVCEHIPFHISMMLDGKGKLFVDPSLRLIATH